MEEEAPPAARSEFTSMGKGEDASLSLFRPRNEEEAPEEYFISNNGITITVFSSLSDPLAGLLAARRCLLLFLLLLFVSGLSGPPEHA